MQGTAHLRGLRPIPELLSQTQRRPGVAVKDAMAIGISGAGKAIAPDELAEEEEVAMGVLLQAKDGRQDASGRIVDSGEKDETGAAVFEPGVLAAVHLDEQAGLRHALAPAPMAWGAARPGTADAGSPEQALHCFPGHAHPLSVSQQIGELVIVHARVEGPGQGQDASADIRGQPARGGPAAVAVGEGRGAVPVQAPQEPPEVTRREAQEVGGFPSVQDTVKDAGQDLHTLVLSPGQGDRLPGHGRTYSLTH